MPLSDSSTYQERYAIKRHLANAKYEAGHLLLHAEAGDPLSMALAAQQLKTHLRELWRLRKAKEDEWGEIVNMLQCAFRQVTPELLTLVQARAVRTVVRDHLALGTVDSFQPRRVREILDDADFDAWAGFQLRADKGEVKGS